MVEELAELHHHVGVARVRQVLVRMVPLRHPAGVGEGAGGVAAPGFAPPILHTTIAVAPQPRRSAPVIDKDLAVTSKRSGRLYRYKRFKPIRISAASQRVKKA